jgi:hypothetical protein
MRGSIGHAAIIREAQYPRMPYAVCGPSCFENEPFGHQIANDDGK